MSDHQDNQQEVDDLWQSFTYLTVDKSDLYRQIVEVFAAAKNEFVLHLRPAEIHAQLQNSGYHTDQAELESALERLEIWGNLQSYQDNADAASLTDFYRKKLLYQLSARGESRTCRKTGF